MSEPNFERCISIEPGISRTASWLAWVDQRGDCYKPTRDEQQYIRTCAENLTEDDARHLAAWLVKAADYISAHNKAWALRMTEAAITPAVTNGRCL